MASFKKKSVLNLSVSIIYKLSTIVLGILIPRLFITSYGSELNGLQSSVSQIFSYLALLEAGVGAATHQSLYSPIGEKNYNKVNSYLSATSSYYNKIGVVYFAVLVSLGFIYSLLVPVAAMHWWLVFVYIVVSGFVGGINYFYLAKVKLLISANGDSFIDSSLLTITYLLTSIAKIALIYAGANIIWIQVSLASVNLLVTFIYYLIAKKKYPWLSFREKPDYECIKQKNSVLVHKISGLIFQNVDVILLTFMCSLEIVSIYTMYKLVINMITTFVASFGDSVEFIFGNKMNTADPGHEGYKRIIDTFNVYYSALSFALYTVTYIMILPFMKLYTAGMDIDYVIELLPWLYIAIEVLTVGREAMMRTISVAGHFQKTQWRAVAETAINLVASVVAIVICKHFFGDVGGLYGALIGTIVAMLYRTVDMNIYANVKILNRLPIKTFAVMLTNAAMFLVVALLLKPVIPDINSYFDFIIHGIWITAVVVVGFVLIQSLVNPKEFKTALSMIFRKKQKEKDEA